MGLGEYKLFRVLQNLGGKVATTDPVLRYAKLRAREFSTSEYEYHGPWLSYHCLRALVVKVHASNNWHVCMVPLSQRECNKFLLR
jgi:hypothetical protein